MKIAVIGAGFSGLAVSYFLSKAGSCVTIYDGSKEGEKASVMSSGLLHPYPNLHLRKVLFQDLALKESKALFELCRQESDESFFDDLGIDRVLVEERQREGFEKAALDLKCPIEKFSEKPIKESMEGLFLKEGGTVFPGAYLKALQSLCEKQGCVVKKRQVESIHEFENLYDHIVVAAGKNTGKLIGVPLKMNKGELLYGKFKNQLRLKRSIAGKGHLVKTQDPDTFILGSTYEHHLLEPGVTEKGKNAILQDGSMYMELSDFEVTGANYGYRVSKSVTGVPLIKKISSKHSVMGCMGSRGLLYHALCGRLLKEALLENKEIPKELCDF